MPSTSSWLSPAGRELGKFGSRTELAATPPARFGAYVRESAVTLAPRVVRDVPCGPHTVHELACLALEQKGMSRDYSELALLPGEHNGAVTAISFSPRAKYLATAATDNRICIWEVASRKLMSRYHGSSYALCLAWMPTSEDPSHLLCGMLDGYVVSLQFTPVGPFDSCTLFSSTSSVIVQKTICARGIVIHMSPVEAIAVLGTRIASGSRRELRIWDWQADGKWYSNFYPSHK